jgi:anthranilate synthase/aminodeoxychorismate synthase-like glutamine amidotransferase
MVLMIDNYDSFTYNLVQYLAEIGAEVEVHRNDAITPDQIAAKNPSHIVLSPGPRSPNEAGVCLDVINSFAGRIPILGVCLGHQAIGQAFGGRIVRAPRLMHGKTSPIYHDGKTVFSGMPSPFTGTRYHSLIIDPTSIPDVLEVSAETAEGEIMGVRHKQHLLEGVQFHPESILTEYGRELLRNFLDLRA